MVETIQRQNFHSSSTATMARAHRLEQPDPSRSVSSCAAVAATRNLCRNCWEAEKMLGWWRRSRRLLGAFVGASNSIVSVVKREKLWKSHNCKVSSRRLALVAAVTRTERY